MKPPSNTGRGSSRQQPMNEAELRALKKRGHTAKAIQQPMNSAELRALEKQVLKTVPKASPPPEAPKAPSMKPTSNAIKEIYSELDDHEARLVALEKALAGSVSVPPSPSPEEEEEESEEEVAEEQAVAVATTEAPGEETKAEKKSRLLQELLALG